MLTFILLLLAFVCFVLAAIGIAAREQPASRINLVALGLTLWVLTLVIHAWPG